MAYNEQLAQRVRGIFAGQAGLSEKKMFGGLSFMVNGNMCCGVMQDELMVRVGPARYDTALARPHTQEMKFTGRPMRGMVIVGVEGFASDAALREWVALGREFALSLPPK